MIDMVVERTGLIETRVWRGGTGRPLLYLHGFEQHPGPAGFLTRLAQSHSVRAPELPGYGESGGFDAIQDITDLVLQLRAGLEAWNSGPVDVVGHSLGGMFAAELAVLCPHLVRRLVLVSPYGLWLDSHPLPDPFVLTPKAMSAAKWFNPGRAPNPEPSALGPGDDPGAFRARNLAAATKFLWPLPDRGLSRRLPYLAAPTLLIHGDADGLVTRPYAEEFARLIPNSRLLAMPGAGHLPMFESEDRFVAATTEFLN